MQSPGDAMESSACRSRTRTRGHPCDAIADVCEAPIDARDTIAASGCASQNAGMEADTPAMTAALLSRSATGISCSPMRAMLPLSGAPACEAGRSDGLSCDLSALSRCSGASCHDDDAGERADLECFVDALGAAPVEGWGEPPGDVACSTDCVQGRLGGDWPEEELNSGPVPAAQLSMLPAGSPLVFGEVPVLARSCSPVHAEPFGTTFGCSRGTAQQPLPMASSKRVGNGGRSAVDGRGCCTVPLLPQRSGRHDFLLACKRALFQESDCSAEGCATSVTAFELHARKRDGEFRDPSDERFASVLSPQLLLKTAAHTLPTGGTGAVTAAGSLGSPP
jgi:hypothetical protein